MSMSVTELADLATAPTVSRALAEAARYTETGPFLALRRAVFGSTDFDTFIAVITPEHAIAEGVALIVTAGLIDPEVDADTWPDPSWDAARFAERVHRAHKGIAAWADGHTVQQLTHLFEAAADKARTAERGERW